MERWIGSLAIFHSINVMDIRIILGDRHIKNIIGSLPSRSPQITLTDKGFLAMKEPYISIQVHGGTKGERVILPVMYVKKVGDVLTALEG